MGIIYKGEFEPMDLIDNEQQKQEEIEKFRKEVFPQYETRLTEEDKKLIK